AQPRVADGEAEAIYLINADGTGLHELKGLPEQASWPSWQRIPAEMVEPTPAPTSAEIVGTFEVGVDVRSVVYGEGSVWVAASNDDDTFVGRIVRIDPETHEVQADIPVEVVPTWEVGGGAMVVADGSLWVTGGLQSPDLSGDPADAAVIQIDASTNEVVTTFTLGGFVGADLAFLDGDLWVLMFGDERVDYSMEVVRIDAATGEVVARIPLSASWAHRIVAAEGHLNVIEGGSTAVNVGGHMTSVDPATNAVSSRAAIPSEYSAHGPVSWQGQLWASVDEGFERFDPADAEVIERSPWLDPSRYSVGYGFIEADDRGIWFIGYDGRTGAPARRLVLFDPETGTVTELVEAEEGDPIAIAVSPDAIWVLNYEGTLTHIALR
ncbi:MAG: hypothetical protein WD670_08060, partial [Actinomycetota bacterium]